MSDPDSSSTGSPSATNPDVDTSDLVHSTNNPTTPMNDHLNAQVPGELSPPRSGDAETVHASTRQQPDDDDMLDDDPTGTWQGQYGSSHQSAEGTGALNGGAVPQYVPGSGWNNKKAQDECHRALESLVDKDFTLQEFGDPLLDRFVDQGNGVPETKS